MMIAKQIEFRQLDKWTRRKLRQDLMSKLAKHTVPGAARIRVDRAVAANLPVVVTNHNADEES